MSARSVFKYRETKRVARLPRPRTADDPEIRECPC